MTRERLLASGVLVWPTLERQLDRYRFVALHPDHAHEFRYEQIWRFEGRRGVLGARIIQTAQSPHCGDLAHGYSVPLVGQPHFPRPGDSYVLGRGVLYVQPIETGLAIGLEGGLDPLNLYRCHWQRVTIWFTEEEWH